MARGGMFPDGPVFVIVGSGGTILTSPDAAAWTRVSGTFPDLRDVAHNGSRFVAGTVAGSAEAANVLYSSDGMNWLGAILPGKPANFWWPFYTHTIGVVGPYFIATGTSMLVDEAWRSSDGKTWQTSGFAGSWVNGIASSNALVVMVGDEGWPRVSTNRGATWFASTSRLINENGEPPIMAGSDITYGNGIFLVSRQFYPGGLLTTDGNAWARPDAFAGAYLLSVAYGNGTFVTVCSGGSYPPGIYQSAPVAVPILSIARQTNAVSLSISGESGRVYRLEVSADLKTWGTRQTYTNAGPVTHMEVPVTAESTQLFFRAVSP